MAVNTFDSHLAEVGAQLQMLRNVIGDLDEILTRHNNNAYSSLIAGDYTGRAVTKAQYDAAMSSVDNLINTWLTAGNGTNIDGYLYEVP